MEMAERPAIKKPDNDSRLRPGVSGEMVRELKDPDRLLPEGRMVQRGADRRARPEAHHRHRRRGFRVHRRKGVVGQDGRHTDDAGYNRLRKIPQPGIPVLHHPEREQEDLQVV